jgi:hypothetical protein
MQASNIPAKLTIPFANAGTKNTIPTASQIGVTNGAASLTDGFPPLTMTPLSAGGVPPFGQDMNGILYMMSAWEQWQAAGGPVFYDSAFSTAIGGYPKGAVLANASGVGIWVSTVDSNTSNPDTGGAGWITGSTGHGQCYFSVTSSTVCTLMPQNGVGLIINGSTQAIPSAGITLSSTGLAATTLYYVYAFMNSGVMTLEASTTTHVAASNGVQIKSGDATRTLVGMVYCFTAATFPTTANQIGALSFFNRKRRQSVFQQTTGGGVASWTSAAFTDVYPTANISFLTWADEAPLFVSMAEVTCNTSNASVSSIITIDGNQVSAQAGWSASFAGAIGTLTMSGSSATVAEGYHVMSFHANVSSGIGGASSLMNQALVSG